MLKNKNGLIYRFDLDFILLVQRQMWGDTPHRRTGKATEISTFEYFNGGSKPTFKTVVISDLLIF